MARKLRIAVIALFVLFCPLFAQYDFDFTITTDTIIIDTLFMEFHFRLENIGTLPDTYALDCRIISDTIPGWFEQFCAAGLCVEPGAIIYDYLDVGEVDTEITVDVYPTADSGMEVLNLHVQSLAAPSLKDSINVYAVYGTSGPSVEEHTGTTYFHPMLQINPNPFSEKTEITYSVGRSAKSAKMKIYDVTGRLIKNLALHTPYSLLPTAVSWNGTDNSGQKLPGGIYFIKIDNAGQSLIRKAIFLR